MTFMATAPTPKRGEVWLVDFNPSVGAEIRKVRPAVVISMDGIGKLPLRIAVPITDWKPYYAQASWFVYLAASAGNGMVKDSAADAFQVKSVSENRFVSRIGVLTSNQVDDIAAAVALCVGAP
jgi:mRNA interferase MazF